MHYFFVSEYKYDESYSTWYHKIDLAEYPLEAKCLKIHKDYYFKLLLSDKTFLSRAEKSGLAPIAGVSPVWLLCFCHKPKEPWAKVIIS